jgi:hypothetical protein
MTVLLWAAIILGGIGGLVLVGVVCAVRSLNASMWRDVDGIDREGRDE